MANFNGKVAITAIVAAGIAALLLWQENSIARTRTNNDALTTRLAELEQTRAEHAEASSAPSPADLAGAAARDRAELERLRGQAALLGPRLQEARAAREDAAKAAAAAGAGRPAPGPV